MKFGEAPSLKGIDLSLPADHPATTAMLSKHSRSGQVRIHVGCAKWNAKDLKNFYPPGTTDELTYYASQFNSIELNATFYRQFPKSQFETWARKVPDGFKFFPKVHQDISRTDRMAGSSRRISRYCDAVRGLGDRLGVPLLKLEEDLMPAQFPLLRSLLKAWPADLPLAIEFRHIGWYSDRAVNEEFYELLQERSYINVITDSAGRRDLMHMRLSTPHAFIRFVGANQPSDPDRLLDWIPRLKKWIDEGIEQIDLFIHQHREEASPALAAHFIPELNKKLGTDLHVPKVLLDPFK